MERLTNLSDRDLLVMNTEDTKHLLESVSRIDQHLLTLNGKVNDTMVKLAKAEEIAKTAILKAECAETADKDTNKRINGIIWAVLGVAITTIVSLVMGVITFFIEKGLKV